LNAWRAVPVNLVFGAVLILALAAWAGAAIVAAAAVSVLFAPPIAGLFRLGARAERGLAVRLSDAVAPMRESPVAVLLAGVAFAAVMMMMWVNLTTGLLVGGILPWMVSIAAAWGMLGTFVFGFAYWPLAVDPDRAGMRHRDRARLAAMVAFAHPAQFGALALILVAILVVSTVLFVLLLTVAVALCAFIACRYVLPAADRLEARLRAPQA
jgi:hypothetical protein